MKASTFILLQHRRAALLGQLTQLLDRTSPDAWTREHQVNFDIGLGGVCRISRLLQGRPTRPKAQQPSGVRT